MYNPMSSCSAFIHLLLKHPILIIVTGLVAASGLVSTNQNPDKVILVNKIMDSQEVINVNLSEIKSQFNSIERNGGLNNMAVKDVLGKVPACQNLNKKQIMDKPEMIKDIAYLYYLDLIYKKGGNIKAATDAFKNPPD